MQKFPNRTEAGKALSNALTEYQNHKDVIVLGLPRGGIPVAFEVAKSLHAPLDVFIVRKLGVPTHEEFAMGAISMGGVKFINWDTVNHLHISEAMLQEVIQSEERELKRREKVYRGNRPPLEVTDKIVILIDDGIATGASIMAAILALKQLQPKTIIVAVPVAPKEITEKMAMVDKFLCLLQPEGFYAVGAHYEEFPQTSDEEVIEKLSLV